MSQGRTQLFLFWKSLACSVSFKLAEFPFLFSRGGKYSEDDAKAVMVQILSVTAYCHLQGVVHRDLKPEVVHSQISFSFWVSTDLAPKYMLP